MYSSNIAKIFYILLLALTLFPACFYRQTESGTTSPTPFISEELKSEIPFSIKEPEVYQAEFVITTGGVKDVTLVARLGANRRYDYNYGADNEFSIVQNAGGDYLISNKKKIYAESAANSAARNSGDFLNSLTTEWLNEKADATYEPLGKENDLAKYLVIFGDQNRSEAVVYVDEKTNLPVRQEFYSIEDERRNLTYTFEMRNFQPQANADLFTVPADFRKVVVEEFRRISHSIN